MMDKMAEKLWVQYTFDRDPVLLTFYVVMFLSIRMLSLSTEDFIA